MEKGGVTVTSEVKKLIEDANGGRPKNGLLEKIKSVARGVRPAGCPNLLATILIKIHPRSNNSEPKATSQCDSPMSESPIC